jgi:hypothetical protein
MADTATLPPPRARPRPRTQYVTLDQAADELGIPREVLHRHDAAVQAGDARPHSLPKVHVVDGRRVMRRADFEAFFYAPDDGEAIIGYGLMATWFGVRDQTLRSKLRERRRNIRLGGRAGPKDIPEPHMYVTVEYVLESGATIERDEPRWRPVVARKWARTTVYWLGRDDVTPTRPRRAGRPRKVRPG